MKRCAFFCFFLVIFLSSVLGGEEKEYIKVAFLGTGKISREPELYDPDLLALLLTRIKEQQPDLVFFTGHLIQGFEESTSPESLKAFASSLEEFSRIVNTRLGKEIPLFPILGNHQFVNSEAVRIFTDHFRIPNAAPLESYQLAYTISKGNAQFTVLATGSYERKFRGYGYYARSMPILDWIEKNLRTGAGEYDFRFVIAHEPVFSLEKTLGLFKPGQTDAPSQEKLWKLFEDHDVTGYFCSHELVYDRSNRNGVWQIVSGGLGDPKRIKQEGEMFPHFVLLYVPKSKKESPRLNVIDIRGKVWDDFSLTPTDKPVHHLRISQL